MNQPLPAFLHDLLDRGVDPIDDPAARTWLDQHPESLEAFAALRARLQNLGEASSATPRASRFHGLRSPLPLLGIAVAVAALAVLLWPSTPQPVPTPLPRPDFARAGVLRCTAVTNIADGSSSFRTVVETGNVSRRRRTAFRTVREPSASVLRCAVVIATEEVLSQ